MIIGIPRTMHFYNYFPMWKTFFSRLGHIVQASEPTNRSLIDQGLSLVSEDKCLPYKIALGHVSSLKDRCDLVFIPSISSPDKKCFFCPNVIYFPDVVKLIFGASLPILAIGIDQCHYRKMFKTYSQLGKIFSYDSRTFKAAYQQAIKVYADFNVLVNYGYRADDLCSHIEYADTYFDLKSNRVKAEGNLVILLLGYNYYIYDRYITFDLVDKLKQMGLIVVTPDMHQDKIIEANKNEIVSSLNWYHSKAMLKAALYYLKRNQIDGIINLAFFNCTTNAANTKLVEHINLQYQSVPLMNLIMDEHSSETGILTRLEAFVDTVSNLKKLRGNP